MLKKTRIGDLGKVIGGATPSTKDPLNYNGEIPWLTPKDLSSFQERYIKRGSRNITEKGYKSCSTKMLPKNSILITSRAPIGYIAIAENEICTNQGFKSLVPNNSYDYLYLYYLIKNNIDLIKSMGNGSTFKEISGKKLAEIELLVEDNVEVQSKIGKFLGNIDDLIEILNQINQKLEEQLSLIFRSKFSTKIQTSNQKESIEKFIEIIDNRGKTPPYIEGESKYPVIDVASLKGNSRFVDVNNIKKFVNKETYLNWFRSGHPKYLDILISTVGTIAQIKFFNSLGCIAQNVVAWRAKNLSPYYLFQYLKYITSDLISYDIGSVQPSIKVSQIKKHPIYIPEQNEMYDFDLIAKPSTELIRNNQEEIGKLKKVQNILLPKLISGQIDVSKLDL